MPYDTPLHQRRSIRIPGFDYSQPGLYFITIVTHERIPLFGKIENDQMQTNIFGNIARNEWFLSSTTRDRLSLFEDEFIVMPNHVHGILHLIETKESLPRTEQPGIYGAMPPGSVPAIIRAYKSAVSKRIHEIKGGNSGPVWQKNYYEHVIRIEKEYEQIQHYIQNNPLNWKKDPENTSL